MTQAELAEKADLSHDYIRQIESEKVAKHLMQDFERFKKVELEGNELTIYVDNLKQDSQEILKWMTDQNILLLKYEILEPTLESLFMEVVR